MNVFMPTGSIKSNDCKAGLVDDITVTYVCKIILAKYTILGYFLLRINHLSLIKKKKMTFTLFLYIYLFN